MSEPIFNSNPYSKIGWKNDQSPPLNATNLNYMDSGINQGITNTFYLNQRINNLKLSDISSPLLDEKAKEVVIGNLNHINWLLHPESYQNRVTLNARLTNRSAKPSQWEPPSSDTSEAANNVRNFIPLSGEFIVYLPENENDPLTFKIGDGKRTVSQLPIASGAVWKAFPIPPES